MSARAGVASEPSRRAALAAKRSRARDGFIIGSMRLGFREDEENGWPFNLKQETMKP